MSFIYSFIPPFVASFCFSPFYSKKEHLFLFKRTPYYSSLLPFFYYARPNFLRSVETLSNYPFFFISAYRYSNFLRTSFGKFSFWVGSQNKDRPISLTLPNFSNNSFISYGPLYLLKTGVAISSWGLNIIWHTHLKFFCEEFFINADKAFTLGCDSLWVILVFVAKSFIYSSWASFL